MLPRRVPWFAPPVPPSLARQQMARRFQQAPAPLHRSGVQPRLPLPAQRSPPRRAIYALIMSRTGAIAPCRQTASMAVTAYRKPDDTRSERRTPEARRPSRRASDEGSWRRGVQFNGDYAERGIEFPVRNRFGCARQRRRRPCGQHAGGRRQRRAMLDALLARLLALFGHRSHAAIAHVGSRCRHWAWHRPGRNRPAGQYDSNQQGDHTA